MYGVSDVLDGVLVCVLGNVGQHAARRRYFWLLLGEIVVRFQVSQLFLDQCQHVAVGSFLGGTVTSVSF